MLDVSDAVRAEIGDEEAERLLTGQNAPDHYDCTSCRSPGDSGRQPTSTVLFVGEETAVLAFAHASCVPSQVVNVSEDQIQGAVATITGPQPGGQQSDPDPESAPQQAVLGITCGQVLVGETLYPALVVEPTTGISRPGSAGTEDEFLTLLVEQGFAPLGDLNRTPAPVHGWSVLLAMGKLHAILQPPTHGGGQPVAWWQAHQALDVTDDWRATAKRGNTVLVYAAPAGSIGQQPREDLLRGALEQCAARGQLVAAAMPLAGT
ncbi:hypothetical protein [Streptomyces sp. NPDC005438]|uniref:hypothetical protein n=1 Tax=Streptomyces sp. NPDC005438 TaxID=3156880 RepID=UPI00339DB911